MILFLINILYHGPNLMDSIQLVSTYIFFEVSFFNIYNSIC